jgi:hypothetical protein
MSLSNRVLKFPVHLQPAPKLAVPWKDILTSVPFWALLFTHTLNNFGWYMLLVELPMFMSTGLGFNIKEVRRPGFDLGTKLDPGVTLVPELKLTPRGEVGPGGEVGPRG